MSSLQLGRLDMNQAPVTSDAYMFHSFLNLPIFVSWPTFENIMGATGSSPEFPTVRPRHMLKAQPKELCKELNPPPKDKKRNGGPHAARQRGTKELSHGYNLSPTPMLGNKLVLHGEDSSSRHRNGLRSNVWCTNQATRK